MSRLLMGVGTLVLRATAAWLGRLPKLRVLYLNQTQVSHDEVRRWQAALSRPIAVMQ